MRKEQNSTTVLNQSKDPWMDWLLKMQTLAEKDDSRLDSDVIWLKKRNICREYSFTLLQPEPVQSSQSSQFQPGLK